MVPNKAQHNDYIRMKDQYHTTNEVESCVCLQSPCYSGKNDLPPNTPAHSSYLS